ncbi:hypothetical protein [Actinosynnema sp. NPDC023587]|uniref:hypothetical protein n=1 Tax=Actinosynnema sp. NPDC023587 TaxID=3154695 RepID=UPI0033C6B2C0
MRRTLFGDDHGACRDTARAFVDRTAVDAAEAEYWSADAQNGIMKKLIGRDRGL